MFCFRAYAGAAPGSVPAPGRVLPLDVSALTAGSSPDNDLVLPHATVPPVAFRLTVGEESCSLTAAGAEIPLYLNGRRTTSAHLRPGDRLDLGELALVLDVLPDDDAAPAGQGPAEDGSGAAFRDHLTGLCALVAEERDLPALLEKLMTRLLQAMGGDEAFLFTLDPAGRPELFVSSRGPASREQRFSDTVVTRVLQTRRGLVLGNALADPGFASAESINDLKLHSVLCCPIVTAGRVGGLIYLGSNRPSVSYGEPQLRDLEVYALVAGCLINHVAFINRQGKVLESLRKDAAGAGMVAFCPPMRAAVEELRAVAASDLSVLLAGETGTGKDVAAAALHNLSRRSAAPFLVVNCGTLRGELLASELFGHRKGAFTGAMADHKGLFAAADGGTLFLDEIGEMDLPLQAMLLRALETGKVRPVGQSAEVAVDVRIVCATNRDLEDMVAKGTFRRDLFYRLNQHTVRLPPLRERGEDILVLAHHFLEKARAAYPDKRIEGFHPDALAAMAAHDWPGNVRELANLVHKAVIFSASPLIQVSGLPEPGSLRGRGAVVAAPQGQAGPGAPASLEEATREFQQRYIQDALARSGGDKEKAAALLGIGRSTFFRHLSQVRDLRGQDEGRTPGP